MIKYIFCDIDGTLVKNDKSLSDENIFWIRKAIQEKGIHFAIATGRMITSVKHFGQIIGADLAAVAINGTYMMDDAGNVFSQHFLNEEDLFKALKIREELNIDMLAVCSTDWYTLNRQGFLYEKVIKNYFKPSIEGDFFTNLKGKNVNKLLFMTPDGDKLEQLKNKLASSLSYICTYSGSFFYEVMPGSYNKGTGIDEFCEYMHLSRDEIMAIGDDENDVEMLKNAGVSVAMGNAPDYVKKVAKFVTDTNENDGVAKAIKRFVFEDLG